jgi:hypothetical protein
MRLVSHLPVSLVAISFFGCGAPGGDRQEVISSLRTFGISVEPLVPSLTINVASPSIATVKLYAAVPLGETATLSPFVDSGSANGAIPISAENIEIQAGSEEYVDYNKFRLFTALAKVTLPGVEAFRSPGGFTGGQVRYGLSVATATQREDVISNIAVFPEDSPEAGWTNPTVDISSFKNGASVKTGKVQLAATITKPNEESVKLGWFVSSGEIQNRRAEETTWQLSDSGPQTVAVTIHGSKSRGFFLKVVDVTGE